MVDNTDKVVNRTVVWQEAADLAGPIIEKYGLTEYRTGASIGYSGSIMTPVDQHIAHVTDLATWLLGEGV